MKVNKLGFLSILALLGFMGFTVSAPFFGFFGFAQYVRYFFVTPDEMFQQNVTKAASFGFFSGAGVTSLAIVLHFLFPAILPVNIALVSCYVVSMVCFTISLVVLEINEQREMETWH